MHTCTYDIAILHYVSFYYVIHYILRAATDLVTLAIS